MKTYTKLIVVMCYQIFDRMSVAPSSGNFGQQTVPGREFVNYSDINCGAFGPFGQQLKILVLFIGFQNDFFLILGRLKVKRKKLRLDNSYYREFFQKYKMDFGVMVNLTVLGWDRLSHHCRNLYI